MMVIPVPYFSSMFNKILPMLKHVHTKNIIITIIFTSLINAAYSIDRNIGIQFTDVPESSVVPPGDLVFFACKTDLGKGKARGKSTTFDI